MIDRNRCQHCGEPISPAATYCAMCGKDVGWKKRGCGCGCGCWTLIFIILVALAIGYGISESDLMRLLPPEISHELEKLKHEIEELIEGRTPGQEPATQPASPTPAPSAKPPQPGAPQSPTNTIPASQDGTYTTQRGFLASWEKDDLVKGLELLARSNRNELNRMVEQEKVVWLRAGLRVTIDEIGPEQVWVRVRIVKTGDVFYTVPGALTP